MSPERPDDHADELVADIAAWRSVLADVLAVLDVRAQELPKRWLEHQAVALALRDRPPARCSECGAPIAHPRLGRRSERP
jgi:hypothetical protein